MKAEPLGSVTVSYKSFPICTAHHITPDEEDRENLRNICNVFPLTQLILQDDFAVKTSALFYVRLIYALFALTLFGNLHLFLIYDVSFCV